MKPASSLTNSAKKTSMKPKSYSTMSIAGVVSFYMLVSIALVFQNKILLNEFGFPYPLLITLFQLIVTSICLFVLGTFGQR